jgi:hypothetical protein
MAGQRDARLPCRSRSFSGQPSLRSHERGFTKLSTRHVPAERTIKHAEADPAPLHSARTRQTPRCRVRVWVRVQSRQSWWLCVMGPAALGHQGSGRLSPGPSRHRPFAYFLSSEGQPGCS